jgi:pyruvate dehydrogenase E2 component (dihydrolipoamide acetyltransferase)
VGYPRALFYSLKDIFMPIEVVMPKLGLNMSEGRLLEWLRKEGDSIQRGDPLFVVETDKVTTESEALASGILGKILVPAGETVPVRTVVAHILAGEEADRSLSKDPKPVVTGFKIQPEAPRGATTEGSGKAPASTVAVPEVTGAGSMKALASPVARRMAKEHGIDLTSVKGSGPGGRIIQEDVERALLGRQPVPAVQSTETRIPIDGIRAVIARRMAGSLASTAPVTLQAETDVSEVVAFRERLREKAGYTGAPFPGYNAIFIWLVAKALCQHPMLNAKQDGDFIQLQAQINVGLAVDTPAGLVVVVVREADKKTILDIHQELDELVRRALERKSLPEDLEGGTFTITNLGAFGVDAFTPIINPPEMAILGIGRIAEKLVIRSGKVMQRQISTLSLTFDHRLVDGAPAGRFLQTLTSMIEELGIKDNQL